MVYVNRIRESITSRISSHDIWGIVRGVFNKGKCPVFHLFNGPEVFSSASVEETLFPEIFSANSNLYDSGMSLLTNIPFYN